ncbi:MarR family winged helix-turn-helix transcriptional regulator [Aquirhabdus parva]|uniref:MarR family transcriptional regulator n=1 Tax=Aquirhabdus parva TaxID=2283318 RepID=A0A345P9U0_9GAMM|nr:MarR family transcriptional regulator [Aquirhabdus parva]AXI04049.1 MarR family transcriptional regulator [Aquirhabdus parva]
MNKSKRLNYAETRDRIERSHSLVTGGPLGTIQINLLIKYNGWLLHEFLGKTLQEFNLSTAGYITMHLINSAPDQIANPSDLTVCTGETRANMTRISDELVERGLLRRVTNEHDRRRVDLSLTDEGNALLKQVVPHARARGKAIYGVFDDEELAMFEKLLLKLLHSLELRVAGQ